MAQPRESSRMSMMEIKCAGCGKAIDIMTLADHVCGASDAPAPAPAAPASKFNLFGLATAQTSTNAPPPEPEKPSVGGLFGWRKATAPATIDTSEANRSYDATPELSGSDYSDDEDRSASPVTPSTQITSPGSTWSRGVSKERGMSDTQSQKSPSSEKPLSDESLAETTTRLGGLFGAGGIFKRLNNVAAGPFVGSGANDSAPTVPEKNTTTSNFSSDNKPKFRNAAGRDQLRMGNKMPSPMQEVFGSKAPPARSNDMFADIQDSNPYGSARGRSKTDAGLTARTTPQTTQKDGLFKSASVRTRPMPGKTKFDYSQGPPVAGAGGRRKFSDANGMWNSSSGAGRPGARPLQGRMRAPSFKTDIGSLRSDRAAAGFGSKSSFGASAAGFGTKSSFGASNAGFGSKSSYGASASVAGSKSSFGASAAEPRAGRPKMFPEATPLGGAPPPRAQPPPVSRFARNEYDMYATSMSSTPTSVNSAPERVPLRHGRQVSDSVSALSSNASVSSGGSPKHSCRGCTRPIIGRSLRDSSRRLSGRYHSDCFRCAICTAPFPSGEFYVLNNEPLCKRDYHERNGSQCNRCRGGIEGRYVETDKREMFHDGCFCCAECDINLGEEYWEVGGRPMCQAHAMAASKMESKMLPAVPVDGMSPIRSPQKRQTRYGMMADGKKF